MRVAALYDIHGNLPALEAVLAEVRTVGVDQIIIGGDVVPGPMPRETLERLLTVDVPVQFIYGNGEVAVLQVLAGQVPVDVPEAYRSVIRWSAEQLAQEQAVISHWPKTISTEIAGLSRVLFCHATPRHENELFTEITSELFVAPMFEGVDATAVVCGHTHMQFQRTADQLRIVNAGSVGMPFGEPGADWLLLGPDIQFRHTNYDLHAAAECVRATKYPEPEDFVTSMLTPKSALEMRALFERAVARTT